MIAQGGLGIKWQNSHQLGDSFEFSINERPEEEHFGAAVSQSPPEALMKPLGLLCEALAWCAEGASPAALSFWNPGFDQVTEALWSAYYSSTFSNSSEGDLVLPVLCGPQRYQQSHRTSCVRS